MSKPSSPHPRRTPAGLYLPLRATLAGRVRWQTLDERGVPEVPRNPSGFAIAPLEGVGQENLITDLGMNRMTVLDYRSLGPTLTATWRRRLAVGTGSTAPNVADTTLDAEVQRDADAGGFASSETAVLDTANDVWRNVTVVPRVVTMSADRNLTEFGFAQNTTGDIVIRELFRDGLGNPVTISLLSGKKILVTHTLTVEIPAPPTGHAGTLDIEEYDASNALVQTLNYDVTWGMFVHNSDSSARVERVFRAWNPSQTIPLSSSSYGGTAYTAARAYARVDTVDRSTNAVWGAAVTLDTYVDGSFTRTKRATLSAAQANGAIYALSLQSNFGGFANQMAGLHVEFTDPATYTKVNTDTLRMGLVATWARA